MDFSLPIRTHLAAAEEASSPSTSLVQLPTHNESSIRTLDDMTVSIRLVNPKANAKGMVNKKAAKKTTSAAALVKKGSKVVKNKSLQTKKTSKKARVPSTPLSRRLKTTVAEAREHIRADGEREISNIFNTLVHTLTLNGDNDNTFVNSVNDATRILTAPLDAEQVQSTYAREAAHVTRTVVMRDRIRFYEEAMKAKQEAVDGYFAQLADLEHDMKKLGSHVNGPDVAHAGDKIEIVMTDDFIEQMKRATRDDYRALDNWTYKLQEMDNSLMAHVREVEKEFENDVRDLKSSLFQSIL